MIPRETYEAYYNAIEAGGAAVSEAVEVFVNSFLNNSRYSRRQCEAIYKRLCEFYGQACAKAALEFYLEMRDLNPVMDDFIPQVYTEVLNNAPTILSISEANSNPTQFLQAHASKWSRQQAASTIYENAARDPRKPRCARVAHANACEFCRMLASLGFWYTSEKTAYNAERLHDNCHCSIVVEFSSSPELEGYDWQPFYKEYEQARGAIDSPEYSTDRNIIISRMGKLSGRNHNSPDYYQRVTKPKLEAQKAANK